MSGVVAVDTQSQLLSAAFAQAPAGLIMPQPIEAIVTWVFALSALAVAGYALSRSLHHRTPVPLLFLIGGLFTVMLEAPADILINVTHPPAGQTTAFIAEGLGVPLYVAIAYFSYYGSLAIVLYERIRARDIDAASWWKLSAGSAIALVVGESLFTWLGLFHFYGRQPLWIGPMPLWFEGANTASLIVPVLVIYMLLPALRGWRQALIPLILPAVGCGAHFGAGIPAYFVLGMDQSRLPEWLVQLSGLASLGFSALLIWIGITLATETARVQRA